MAKPPTNFSTKASHTKIDGILLLAANSTGTFPVKTPNPPMK
jgi:hypothetical protein